MVPVAHGPPELGLVPWVKLTQARLGFHGPLTERQWLYLWPRPDWEPAAAYDWVFHLGPPGCKPGLLCHLREYDTPAGLTYLAGSLGTAWLVVKTGGVWPSSKKPYVSVYWAVSPYAGRRFLDGD
jgi:hypothetical protein